MKKFTVTATVIDGKQKLGVYNLEQAFQITKWRLFDKRLTPTERAFVQACIGFYAITTLGREI